MPAARLIVVLACLLAPAAARAADGSVSLYLQALPSEASRLTFALDSVIAVAGNGAEHPLTLLLPVVESKGTSRQRLLAFGRLPVGEYKGFALRVTRASLATDRGDAALIAPDEPVELDMPFSVTSRQARLLWLALRYGESITESVAFRPVFSTVSPSLPVTDHLGFVTSSGWNLITVFDKRLAQAVASIDTCAGPSGLALDQRRRRLYVACVDDDEIEAIDIASGQIIRRVSLSPGDRPRELALTSDGTTLMSVNSGSNSVDFFDALPLARQERLEVGDGPRSILIDRAGTRAFVFNTLSSSVSVIDIANRTRSATLSMDAPPLRGAFNERGNVLFVIHERSPHMTVIDPQQLMLVTRARLATSADAIAVDSVRGLVSLVGAGETTVEFYDPNALLPLYAMPIKAGVSFMTIDALDSRVYLLNPRTRRLVASRLADRTVASEIDVGAEAYWVAVMGER